MADNQVTDNQVTDDRLTGRTRWAVLGPGAISADFVAGLRASRHGVLHAVGSSDPARAAAFAQRHGAAVSGDYAAVLARDDVDAVYVATVHTTHAPLAIAALEAGKPVLCEKPLTPSLAETRALLAAARASGQAFLEAFKYRFGPAADLVRELVATGAVGAPQRLEAALGFAAGTRSGRLFDPALAGGAILDIGCYPVSLAVGVAAWAGMLDGVAPDGVAPDGVAPLVTDVTGRVGDTGVDEVTHAVVHLGDVSAQVGAAITEELPAAVTLHGSDGWLDLTGVWGERDASASHVVVHRNGEQPRRLTVPTVQPMAAEADALTLAVREGRSEVAEMPWRESELIARVLQDWRGELVNSR